MVRPTFRYRKSLAGGLLAGLVLVGMPEVDRWQQRRDLREAIAVLEEKRQDLQQTLDVVASFKQTKAELDRKVEIIQDINLGRSFPSGVVDLTRRWSDRGVDIDLLRIRPSGVMIDRKSSLTSDDIGYAVDLAMEAVDQGVLDCAEVLWRGGSVGHSGYRGMTIAGLPNSPGALKINPSDARP